MPTVSKKVATIEAVLRRSHTNAAGEHPVKIRVTFNRQAKFYPVNIDGKPLYLTLAEWEELGAKQVRKTKKKINDEIDKVKASAINARNVIAASKTFSFERFEKEFLTNESSHGFLKLFQTHLQEILKEDRIGTYKAYNNAFQAINKFRGGNGDKLGRDLSPVDVTPLLLKDFETFLRNNGAEKSTIAFYMRGLKVIVNVAISRNPSLAEFYPFATKQNDKGKYKIKTSSSKKGEALSADELKSLINTETKQGTTEHEAKKIWLFSFYCQGMNFKDISRLKYSNIQGRSIKYIRQKTKDTESDEQYMEIPLTDSIRQIIVDIGNPDKRNDSFVFDIIPKGMATNYRRRILREKSNEERTNDVVNQKLKITNQALKRLCVSNGLPEITTYWSRHSYANLLKQNGVSIDVIREMLGHSDVRTTETYLRRFDIERKRKVNENIEAVLKVS